MTNIHGTEFNLQGQTALVTGGASGIGAEVARALRAAHAKVVAFDIQSPQGAAYPTDEPGSSRFIVGDVTDESACQLAVDEAITSTGRLDILVNVAGILQKPGRTQRQSTSDWQRTVDVNLGGTFKMSKVAASAMATRKSGCIVNISSVAGLVGFQASNAYGVAKAGVAMMTRTMAADLARDQIRVNAVAPGFIDTPMTENLGETTRASRDAYIQRIPMRRFGRVEEIAQAVLFLCSGAASYITGAVIPVDGGWTAFGGPNT